MKTKNFQKYLEKRLDKDEIAEIKEQAQREVKILKSIQHTIAATINDYMKKHKIGFNELVRRLDSSPTQVAKIQRGEANLTMASLAHLLSLMGKEFNDIFKKKR